MTIVPIKDLKDGAKISKMCHELDEPIHITKNGYDDMVIMSTETFKEYERLREAFQVAANVRRGLDEIDQGKGRPAGQVLDTMRSRYGL